MADVSAFASPYLGTEVQGGLWGPYWTSPSVGYFLVKVEGADDLAIIKTTDSGASWAEVDSADAPGISDNATVSPAAWFDQETPGNSGTKIYVAYADDDAATFSRLKYVTFDTSTDQWGTPVTVRDVENGATTWIATPIAITLSVGGVLFIAGQNNGATQFLYRSTDGSSWTSKAAPGEAAADRFMLFPANLADTNDIWCLFHDASANELSLKTYDDSANSWSEAAVDAATESSSAPVRFFDGAIRHSDGHLLACVWTLYDNAAADLATWDITDAGTITAKGDCVDTSDDCAWCGILINQQNNDVYIAYLGNENGSETAGTALSAFYKKSTDGMASWGSQTAYSSGAADDYKIISAGRTVGSAGGRFMPVWFDDDDYIIFVNDGNDVEIAAAAGGDPEGRLKGGKLIRGGLLRGGVLAA